jgi:imidazoleglycerol-phosphate dehydratase
VSRLGRVERRSRETELVCELELDVLAPAQLSVGVPFLEHLLEQVARFGRLRLRLEGHGDVEVDPHHLVEDAGIVVGQALDRALGERAGIARFAHAYAPLDEALARVVVDLGRRPHLVYAVPLDGTIGSLEAETLEEWWRAFAIHAGATLHVDLLRGRNRHHMAEACFKALGLALGRAVAVTGEGAPSTKGMLG